MLSFSGLFEDAVDYVHSHRNMKPPIYNERRVKEIPIPSLGIHDNLLGRLYESGYFDFDYSFSGEEINDSFEAESHSQLRYSDTDADGSFESFDHSLNQSLNQPLNESEGTMTNHNSSEMSDAYVENPQIEEVDHNEFDRNENTTVGNDVLDTNPLENIDLNAADSVGTDEQIGNNVDNGNDTEPLIDQSTDESDNNNAVDPLANIELRSQVKAESVPLYENYTRNSAEMDTLLDEPEEIFCDEDMTITIPKGGIPKPLASTGDDMIKCENDKISGSIPFNANVSILDCGKYILTNILIF